MFKSINQFYIFSVILLQLIFLPALTNEYPIIYLINFLISLSYIFLINYFIKRNISYSNKNLSILVSIYSIIIVLIYKVLSYYSRGNFFVFSEIDAIAYHNWALDMSKMNLVDSIKYFLHDHSFEDLGAVLVISLAYKLIPSTLFINAIYVLVGLITAGCIYRISTYLMKTKYAFICAFAYSTASYVLWFHSSGLKESFLVMLVMLFYDLFYKYYKLKKLKYLLLSLIPLSAILLFRPAVVYFCIGSVGIGALFAYRINATTFTILLIAIIFGILLSEYFTILNEKFLYSSTSEMIEIKEKSGMVKGDVSLTYITNGLAGLIGPMPTILPNTKIVLSLYSPGLIYKVLLSSILWIGVFYAIKLRAVIMFPLVFFLLLEVLPLIYIMEALELRKSLPHFPMVYIISFWFISIFSTTKYISNRNKKRIKIIANSLLVIFVLLIIRWNLR